jgi:hypothetical protein
MTKEDQNELLDAALKLAEIMNPAAITEETKSLIAKIEKHRPAKDVVDAWIRVGPDGRKGYSFASKEIAEFRLASDWRVVRVREVLPWKRWIAYDGPCEIGAGEKRIRHYNVSEICDSHNAEMERVTGTKGEA